jgi:methyl-accepting chemotaxis protein
MCGVTNPSFHAAIVAPLSNLSPFSWSLRGQLVALVVGASIAIAAMGMAATWSSARIADAMGAVQEQRLRPLVRLDALARALERQRGAVLATLAATNDLMVEALRKQAAHDAEHMPREIARLREAAPSAREKDLLGRLGEAIGRSHEDGLAAVLAFLDKGQFVEADVASQSRYRPQVDAASKLLDEAIALQVRLAESDYQAADRQVRIQSAAALAASILALVVGLALASLIARALRRALGTHEDRLIQGARMFAEGRLDHRIEVGHSGESSVAAQMNAMSREFALLVADVARTAHSVAASAERLASGAQDLSERTGEQASSLEQTAASMQQLAAGVRGNVEAAEHATGVSDAGFKAAAAGREALLGTIATLEQTVRSAERVRDIASLIDGIAFQTNILALNAAVEAARAGEHGRGFAVVASEVRALSVRCSGASRDIRGLVEESAAKAGAATRAARVAGESMEAVERSAHEVSARMAGIVESSRSQSVGIQEVNRAVEQLEAATQGNAHLSEQVAAAAAALSAHAESLVTSVSRFSIDEEASPVAQREPSRESRALLPA